MLMLAIETATEVVGGALVSDDGPVASFHLARGRRHAETLAPGIAFLLHQAAVTVDDLTAIAVDVGPGLFTGMRVGLATAKAMAHALELPIVPVTSLEALAAAVTRQSSTRPERIVAVLDARRGEVFWASFRSDEAGHLILHTPAAAATPVDLLAELLLVDEPVLIVGDGGERHRDLLADGLRAAVFADPRFALPDVTVVADLAAAALARGAVTDAIGLQPMYLRAPDAAINWRVRDGGGR
jgi:tRNA threonylcarbamoyladenosine biosynthesis protein TsaB